MSCRSSRNGKYSRLDFHISISQPCKSSQGSCPAHFCELIVCKMKVFFEQSVLLVKGSYWKQSGCLMLTVTKIPRSKKVRIGCSKAKVRLWSVHCWLGRAQEQSARVPADAYIPQKSGRRSPVADPPGTKGDGFADIVVIATFSRMDGKRKIGEIRIMKQCFKFRQRDCRFRTGQIKPGNTDILIGQQPARQSLDFEPGFRLRTYTEECRSGS